MARRRRTAARKNAILAVKAQGCTCRPEIDFDAPDHPLHGQLGPCEQVSVRHDDWCPLYRVLQEREPMARMQAVVCFEDDGKVD
jgi:hypothetical protein